MLPGFRSVPLDDAGALREAVGESTAAVLIEPIQGEAGDLPAQRGGAARRPPGLRRGRRAADLRRDPDRGGADRLALGLRADAGAARPADQRQGARRRPADRRLRRPHRRRARCSSPATTARPSPAAPWPRAAALAVLEIVDDPALLRGVRERGAALREALLALDGVARGARSRPDARGRPRATGSTPPRSAPSLLERGLIVNVPEPGTLRLLPPLTVDSDQIERAAALIGDCAPKLRGRMSTEEAPARAPRPLTSGHGRAPGGDRRCRRAAPPRA